MINIFTKKRGRHESERFISKHRRALIAAAVLTGALLTGVSAAIIPARPTLSAVCPSTEDAASPAESENITVKKHMAALLRSRVLQGALQSEENDGTSDGRTKSISRALKAIAMSHAVREELSERSTVAYANQAVTVFLPKGQFPGETRYENGVTLVDAVDFARFAGECEITWDGDTLYMRSSLYDVSIPLGAEYITSSGRVFWARRTPERDGSRVFVPVDTLCRAFGFECEKDAEGYSVHLTGDGNVVAGADFYREDEVYWLSRIIQAESRGEILTGKIAVGNVVLNRVRDKRFPNTIYGVIFDRSCGIQFSPTANGSIYFEPSEESVTAAKICLEGYSVSDEITFFFNPAISQNTWISDNRPLVCIIGNHAFYS